MDKKIKNVISSILNSDDSRLSLMSKGTLVRTYMEWLGTYIDNESYSNPKVCENAPFLSIITRTQGRRPEALQEVLLCLSGQTDMDFELLIMGHNLSGMQEQMVLNMIDNQVEELRIRTKLIKVNGGTRTTPLNEGFNAACGDYIAILDDDDIVFDNWIEEFKKAHERMPGAVLHAHALTQEWQIVKRHVDGLMAVAAPTHEFCKNFDFVDQVNLNYCPPVGLAFPRYAFSDCGINFDETLNTTEDWDLLMRMAFLCNVSDIEEPTCIYRLWSNAETSKTLHDVDEWQKNHQIIQEKFDNIPIILPKKETSRINRLFDKLNGGIKYEEDRFLNAALYIDNGNGFEEKNTLHNPNRDKMGKMKFEYVLNASYKNARRFRWDPDIFPDLLINDVNIALRYSDGSETIYTLSDCYSNGYMTESGMLFVKDDPQIEFIVTGQKEIESIVITGVYENECNKADVTKILSKLPEEYVKSDLYVFGSEGYTESKKQIKYYGIDETICELCYDNLEIYGQIKKLRWDPTPDGMKIVKIKSIKAILDSGEVVNVMFDDLFSNGVFYNGSYVFVKSDPFIELEIGNKILSELTIRFTVDVGVNDDMIDYYVKHGDRNGLLSKLFRKIQKK